MMNGKCFNPLMMDGDGSNLLKHLRGLPPMMIGGVLLVQVELLPIIFGDCPLR